MGTYAFAHAAADNIRVARSKIIATPAVATYDCIQIPKNAFLMDVVLWVKTAGSADTVLVGFIGDGLSADTDHFLAAADAEATATGFKRGKYDYATSDYVPWNGRWLFTASGIVTLTNITAAQTTGEFCVIATYSVLH